MPEERGYWARIKDTLAGWKALVLMFVFGAVAAGVVGEVYRAPVVAQQARQMALENKASDDSLRRVIESKAEQSDLRQIRNAVESLETAFRVYACGDRELDRSAYIRLDCAEFNRRGR